jgi:malate synthase
MSSLGSGIEFRFSLTHLYQQILTPEAMAFAVGLQRTFNGRRKELLRARAARQARLDSGERPDFLPETKHIRDAEWSVSPLPADLLDRRVEITGPVERKMIINALNSGAKVFMADFEDSTTPPEFAYPAQGECDLHDSSGCTQSSDASNAARSR